MVLKITFWNHFQRLWVLLIYCSLIFLLFWGIGFDTVILSIGILMFGALIAPTLIIHLNHYKYCEKRKVILLDNIIKIESADQTTVVDVSDITCITIYMSGTRYSNQGIQSFPFENYFYCKIDRSSGCPIFLSSLFSNNLDKLLEEKYKVPFLKQKQYYPFINR